MESVTTLALLGIWGLAIALVLGFFAGARIMSNASKPAAPRPSPLTDGGKGTLRPPSRKTA